MKNGRAYINSKIIKIIEDFFIGFEQVSEFLKKLADLFRFIPLLEFLQIQRL